MDNRDPLNLNSLPEARAPADLWPAIEARLLSEKTAWPKPRWPWAAGLAAAVLLAVLVTALDGPERAPEHFEGPLAGLQARSAMLEDAIAPMRPVAPSAITAHQEFLIESLLAEVDSALLYAPSDPGLWTRRVQLLEALATTYSDSWMDQQVQLTSL